MVSIPQITPNPETKLCTKCGESKPFSEYYVKVKATGRLFSWCKDCHVILPKREKIYKQLSFLNQFLRLCSVCKSEKPIDDFYQFKNGKFEYRCNDCKNKQTAERVRLFPDKVKESQLKYNRTDKARLRSKRFGDQNRELLNHYYRQKRIEKPLEYRGYVKNYKIRHPEFNRINCQRRRIRKLNSKGSLSVQEWQAIKSLQNYKCLGCGKSEPDIKLTIDHVIPLSKGGKDEADNIQGLCQSCNSRKNVKVIDFRIK